jgi:hypothetical protein
VRLEMVVHGKVRSRLVVASATHFDGEDSGRWVRGVPLGLVVRRVESSCEEGGSDLALALVVSTPAH